MKNKANSTNQAAPNSQPPPRYSQVVGAAHPTPSPSIVHGFPVHFNMYWIYQEPGAAYLHIGEHQDYPLYAITLHPSLPRESEQPEIVLHCAARTEAPVLAMMRRQEKRRARPNADVILEASPAWPRLNTIFQFAEAGGSSGYVFEAAIPMPGGQFRVERFEWRHTSGQELKQYLDRSGGYKLVRLQSNYVTATGAYNNLPAVLSSDGKEVVALYANAQFSGYKKASFRFIGSGAMGELGPQWTLLAVTSMLAMWYVHRENFKEDR